MNKEQLINDIVVEGYESFTEYLINEVDFLSHFKWDKFRNCNAKICETSHYIVLKSYDTIVAFINKDSETLFDILRLVYGYTATSSQHIAKFRNEYSNFVKKAYRYYDIY